MMSREFFFTRCYGYRSHHISSSVTGYWKVIYSTLSNSKVDVKSLQIPRKMRHRFLVECYVLFSALQTEVRNEYCDTVNRQYLTLFWIWPLVEVWVVLIMEQQISDNLVRERAKIKTACVIYWVIPQINKWRPKSGSQNLFISYLDSSLYLNSF